MISNRQKASFRKRRDSGVSEIIGDILILAMTVILFSSIFVFVNAFPTPNAQTFANFEATLSQPVGSISYINITHAGGEALTTSLTTVVVQVNQTTEAYNLAYGNLSINNTLIPWPYAKWTTGQTWAIGVTSVTPSSVVGVSIIDKANNYLVWSTILRGKPTNVPPVIQTAYANPNPVTPGNTITVFAKIYSSSNHINVTANLSLVTISSGVVNLSYNSSTGVFQSAKIATSNFLKIGNFYPITVSAIGPGPHSSNYTFNLLVQNTGPSIVMAAISPNPGTLGTYFNITAYVIDNNRSSFQPPAAGSMTVTPQSPMMTNITSTEAMIPSSSSTGIFTLSGRVNSSFTGNFESFLVTATDVNGNKAEFVVELVVIQTLNSSQNTSFPYQYLGPTSMSYSGFSWNTPGAPATKGYEIPASDVIGNKSPPSPGVYFHVIVENHNISETTYINSFSNIYFLFNDIAQNLKLYSAMSFVENSTTQTTLTSTEFIALHPNLPVNLTFGIASTLAPPSGSGPFQGLSSGSGTSKNTVPQSNSISVDFLLLFGYEITSSGQDIPYGQSLPFTAIYWS